MTDYPKLSYRDLTLKAELLALRIRKLHEALSTDPTLKGPRGENNEFDQFDLADLEIELSGIGAVLKLLGRTPTGDVNADAMDCFREVVRKAAELEREPWAAEILERVDPTPDFASDEEAPTDRSTNEFCTPWTLHFDGDGTEDIAIIRDADGEDLVTSRLFWLPEDNDPNPQTLAAVLVMKAAPNLLKALTGCVRLLADHDESEGEEGAIYREAILAMYEASEMPAGR